MRADRLISILMILQTQGQTTAQNLADRLEVSTRTIYRDLDALSMAGVPVYAERGPHGGCALMERYRTNLTGLKESEVRALFMFTVPGLLEDLGAEKESESALLKLTAALPAPFQRSAEIVRQRIHLDPAPWFRPPEQVNHLPTLQDALWNQKRLRIHYRRGNGTWVRQLVDPYGLVAKAGIWYLVARVNLRWVQSYRVSRIGEAEVTEGDFDYPEDFDLATYWTEWAGEFEGRMSTYHVSLRVKPEAIPILVESFGENIHQMLQEAKTCHEDGASLLQFTFESESAACRIVMGLGTHVEIVEPESLRHKIAERARALVTHYTG